MHRRALAGQEKVLGLDHPHTVKSFHNLAILLNTENDFAGAEPFCRRALAGFEKIHGSEHPYTLASVNGLAYCLANSSDRLAEALNLLRGYAAKTPVVLTGVRYNLACYECLSGNLNEAKRLIDEEIASSSAARDQALKDDDLKAIHDYIREKAPIQTARNGEIS